MKKKKVVVFIGISLLLIAAGLFGFQQLRKQKQEKYMMVYEVYQWIGTEEYGEKNPLDLGVTVSELERNPPKVEMNGSKGLYVSVMAYNHATGNSIDYEDIKELMEQGKPLEVYENYQDYLEWFLRPDTSGRYITGYGTDYRGSYAGAVMQAAGKHNIPLDPKTASYKDYKKIIETYPEDIEYFFDNSISD